MIFSVHLRRRLFALAIVPAALAATVWSASSAVASERDTGSGPLAEEYVALGDSFAAGPLLPPQEQLDPCLRSGVNYPHELAAALGATTFRDVTCSGATTDNILDTPQPSIVPGAPARPLQIDAVTPTTTLVTLTIGANDAALTGIAVSCFNALPEPAGVSCKATQTAGGTDRGAAAIDAVAPRIAATLDAIRERAPHARIVTTSYANYIQPGGCHPLQPVWADDADYIQGLVGRLGRVTERVAAEHGAQYVDLIGPGRGHDGCQLTRNWATLIVPGTTLGLVPLHPTALGERNFARIIGQHLSDDA